MAIRAERPTNFLASRAAASTASTSLGRRGRIGLIASAIALTAATVVLVHRQADRAEHDAIVRMAPEQRRAMFDDTRHSGELICAQARAEPALSDRCIETTHFLLAFPECDEPCVAFVRSHEREATR